MNLSEAKQNAKDISATLAALVSAVDGMKDSDFDAMQKRKEAMESAILDAHQRLITASEEADAKVSKVKADTTAKLAELDKQLKDAEAALAAVRTEMNVSRETMRDGISTERAALMKDKQEVVGRLDAQIAAKTKTLNELNAAIDAAKARFA